MHVRRERDTATAFRVPVARPHFHFHPGRIALTLVHANCLGMYASSTTQQPVGSNRTEPRRIDVSDLDTRSVQEFVRSSVDSDEVSLEHRGSRTYLVVGE